jgi:hypothetical protein
VVGRSIFEVTVVVGRSVFEATVVVGIEVKDTVVVGIEVGDIVVEESVVAGVTVVEESGSELTEVTLPRGVVPFESKAASEVLTEASIPDDPSEEPQAESTTNTVTSKSLFMSET